MQSHTYVGHTKPVFDLEVASTGRHFLSYARDGSARLWEVASGREVACLPLAAKPVFAPQGELLLAARRDRGLQVYSAEHGEPHQILAEEAGLVSALSVSPCGTLVLSGCGRGVLRLWDLATGMELYREVFGSEVTSLAFSPCGQFALCALDSCAIWVCDVVSGCTTRQLSHGEQDLVAAVAYSPCGLYAIYSGSGHGIIDMKSGRELPGGPGGGARLCANYLGRAANMAFAPDDQLLASGHFGGRVELWPAGNFGHVRQIETGATWVHALAFSPSGDQLLCATDRSMHIFAVDSGDELQRFAATPTHANWASFLPDGGGVLTGHGALVLDETGERGVKQAGDYLYHDNVVRAWAVDPAA